MPIEKKNPEKKSLQEGEKRVDWMALPLWISTDTKNLLRWLHQSSSIYIEIIQFPKQTTFIFNVICTCVSAGSFKIINPNPNPNPWT